VNIAFVLPTLRRIARWEHEEVLEAAQVRLDQNPDMMRIRRTTVEHPFGTLKAWMGSTHFLTKTLDRVSTELSHSLGRLPHISSLRIKRTQRRFLGCKQSSSSRDGFHDSDQYNDG
jgi:hypothetical protein